MSLGYRPFFIILLAGWMARREVSKFPKKNIQKIAQKVPKKDFAFRMDLEGYLSEAEKELEEEDKGKRKKKKEHKLGGSKPLFFFCRILRGTRREILGLERPAPPTHFPLPRDSAGNFGTRASSPAHPFSPSVVGLESLCQYKKMGRITSCHHSPISIEHRQHRIIHL